jgi:capsular exopolysaccharide synthesis family protein
MLRQAAPSTPTCDEHVVTLSKPLSFEAEQFRQLRRQIEDLAASRGFRVIAVTSAIASDGKTLTAVNLAGALAAAPGSRTLLVDADLRRPSVARTLRLDDDCRGLLAALEDPNARIADFARRVDGSALDVVRCESSRADTYELLASARLGALLADARRCYDFVVVDTPPIVPMPDTGLLRRVVDGYLIVVSANATPRRLVAEALTLLEPTSVIGLVYNRDDRPMFGYYQTAYSGYFRSYARSVRNGRA